MVSNRNGPLATNAPVARLLLRGPHTQRSLQLLSDSQLGVSRVYCCMPRLLKTYKFHYSPMKSGIGPRCGSNVAIGVAHTRVMEQLKSCCCIHSIHSTVYRAAQVLTSPTSIVVLRRHNHLLRHGGTHSPSISAASAFNLPARAGPAEVIAGLQARSYRDFPLRAKSAC